MRHPKTAQASLGDLLAGDAERERILAVIGHLLGLVEQAPAPTEIFWGIRRTFEAMARRRPLVLILDDIHWGEPTFLDLVDHIADWTHDAPILLIAMARPELLEKRPGWGGGKRSATTVQLEPLSAGESDELVVSLLGRAELPAEVMTQISRAAEGNPLFVEELLGKLIDDGFLVRSNGGWAAIGDLRELAIPPTISALMAARLDSLGREERTVIERASVEGKTFHRGAVTAMAPEAMRAMVSERLATLTRMELVRPDQASFAGEEAYPLPPPAHPRRRLPGPRQADALRAARAVRRMARAVGRGPTDRVRGDPRLPLRTGVSLSPGARTGGRSCAGAARPGRGRC